MIARTFVSGSLSNVRGPSRASLVTCLCAGTATAAALVLFAGPAWQRAEANGLESGRLLTRAAQFEALERERDSVQADVSRRRMLADAVLREIPADPQQASVMRMFAVQSGADVGAQTIVAGEALPATQKSSGFKAVPVTIDMTATYAQVMEVLSRAEGARRLVRPIRIEISRPLEDERRDVALQGARSSFVEARIELDAVYGSATSEETVP